MPRSAPRRSCSAVVSLQSTERRPSEAAGHTHEDIDQSFGVISRHLKVRDRRADTLQLMEDLVAALNSAFPTSTRALNVETIVASEDFTGHYAREIDEKLGGFGAHSKVLLHSLNTVTLFCCVGLCACAIV